MDVRFKKLNDLAKIPTRGSKFSAGYDLYAATDKDIQIPPHATVKIGTGLAMDLPSGYFGAIVARSGIATKRGLRPINCLGVCDFDYKGEYIVALHNDTTETKGSYKSTNFKANPSTGKFRATSFNIADKVTAQYNTTTEALDFIFS